MRRAKTEPGAFGEIFDMHYDRIFAYALKRTGDVDIAADVAAETFAKALKSLGWYTWRGIPLSAWLYRIAANEIRMYIRKQKYAPASLSALIDAGYEPEDEELVGERRAIEARLSSVQEERSALEALSTLSNGEQDLIALRYFQGLKTREIADILKRPEGTVRSMLSRTLGELRKALAARMQQKDQSSIIGSEGRSGLLLQITEL